MHAQKPWDPPKRKQRQILSINSRRDHPNGRTDSPKCTHKSSASRRGGATWKTASGASRPLTAMAPRGRYSTRAAERACRQKYDEH